MVYVVAGCVHTGNVLELKAVMPLSSLSSQEFASSSSARVSVCARVRMSVCDSEDEYMCEGKDKWAVGGQYCLARARLLQTFVRSTGCCRQRWVGLEYRIQLWAQVSILGQLWTLVSILRQLWAQVSIPVVVCFLVLCWVDNELIW